MLRLLQISRSKITSSVSTISTNAHWQNGKAERHGEILGQMLSKFDLEQPMVSAVDLQQALAHCTQAKTALSIRKGYAPKVLVLGKSTRLPGAVCSDEQLPAHALADAEHCHGLLFQNLAKRELARRAFHMADNDAVLRRSLLRRSRPSRQWFHQRGMGNGLERWSKCKLVWADACSHP